MHEYLVRYVTDNSMIAGLRITANCMNEAIEYVKSMPNYRSFFAVETID